LADLALGVSEGGVIVRAEVDKLRLLIEKQGPDDDHNRAAHRHDRRLPAASSGDAPVALVEEGVGAAGADRGLAENSG
jgi:hypothetical protein